MTLPAGDDTARVVEPGEEPFDLPASARASEWSSILGASAAAPIRGDHLNAVRRHQHVVERVAVVAAFADQTRREVGEKPGVERGGDEVRVIR